MERDSLLPWPDFVLGNSIFRTEKLLRFIICVCIATLFHQTAIVGFLLLLLNVLQWRDLQQRQKYLYILFVLCLPLIVVLLSQKMNNTAAIFPTFLLTWV